MVLLLGPGIIEAVVWPGLVLVWKASEPNPGGLMSVETGRGPVTAVGPILALKALC